MKINWGTAIVIAFALFMSFIMYFVIKVQTNTKYDNEMVVDEYYKQELVFENQLNRERNGKELITNIQVITSDEGIKIEFPKEFDPKNITGTVSLYRPSNKRLDFEIPISLSDSYILIPKSSLVDGRWDIIINWNADKKDFYFKDALTYKS